MTPQDAALERVRERVLTGLALVAMHDNVCELRAGDAPERVAFDLIGFWFDTVWSPGERYMEGFKGDRDPSAARKFEDAFSAEEYLWLERFNRFLELRVDRLTPEERDGKRFPAGDTWDAIMRDARNLLELLDPYETRRIAHRKRIESFLSSDRE